jgi:hypothetical protein
MVRNRHGMARLSAEIQSHVAELGQALSELSSYSLQEEEQDRMASTASGCDAGRCAWDPSPSDQ